MHNLNFVIKLYLFKKGDVAQLGERRVRNAEIAGSNPVVSIEKGTGQYWSVSFVCLLPHHFQTSGTISASRLAVKCMMDAGKMLPVRYTAPASTVPRSAA